MQLPLPPLRAVIGHKGQRKEPLVQGGELRRLLPGYGIEPQHLTAAGTSARDHPGIVAGAVADQRHGLHADGGDDELAFLPRWQRLPGLVHDLGDHMVFPQMHARMGLAADGAAQGHLPGAVVGEKAALQDRLAASEDGVGAGVAAYEGPPQAAPSADAQQREELYRHAHEGIRSFLLQHGGIFSVREPHAQPERPGSEAPDRLRDQLPQAVGPGKGKADHGDAAGKDQFPQARRKELHRVFAVAFRVKHPLGGAGGAGSGVGEHPLHLRLGAEQQSRCLMGQILVRGKGKGGKLGKRIQMPGQIPVEAAPGLFPGQQGVELLQLHPFNAPAADVFESLLGMQEGIDPGERHR